MKMLKRLFATYFHKYEGEKDPKYIYILIDGRDKVIDFNGYLDTRRCFHNFSEFTSKVEARKFLANEVPKSERAWWVLYRMEKL